ncbi:hypothetical protein Pfo_030185 [Paulownia fortunei]|nr:hypothetical protein Pfo_030185 [Paulownia fortunei]
MHGSQAIARFVIGIIGNIISALLFLSPSPTFRRIWKRKSTEEFHPYPYLACAMNCMFWIFYGLPFVHPDSVLVITINTVGLILELGIIVLFLSAEAMLLAVVAAVTLLCFHTHAKRSMFVGIICVVFGIIMYGSPLSILRKVIKTKSAEFLPFWLCLAGFSNGVVWFIYANLKSFDPYIATGNGVGGLLGFVQLCVYRYYTWKAKSRGQVENDVKPGEVQLQNAATDKPPV